ncbi:hypothetical protein G6F70_002626 [Rhizopus microsporus]|uniref:Uncharacterized protein n=2 Tax=Rhizopus TaxID=4842 RepID=A0A367K0H0_RHIAZ|nr:hypothetical protein G6F71_000918 [Rhizopus microsporus]RCH95668.1 hypothetical protein CU097_014449 [Rhizopus azygosporus]KAG1202022.1 hypothetical protein G6F70_002626 [Rhizopus microsporus]KAG1215340.1 hypothetical protein G6F69_001089 [Rhizopus microsporus]KAG1236111.1 hypothetical protein G6F67_002238 [Rhizopus microsporus]
MKKVQFSGNVEFVSTFANEDYDRTAQEVAKLTYRDMLELLTMKSQWKRDMERMLAEREMKEKMNEANNNQSQQQQQEQHQPLYNVPEICT